MEDEEKTCFTKRHKIPTKMKDRDSFTISCSIGGVCCGKALCDLWASR